MFVRVIALSMPAMRVLAFFVLIMMIFYGALIFAAEKGEWTVDVDHPAGAFLRPTPDHFGVEVSPFRSIPFSFWWVLVTTTTTGYGDFFPTTVMGKTVGVCAMITGILMLALPITVIGANFAHEYEKDRKLKEQFRQEMVLRKERERERRAAGEDAGGGGGAAGGGKFKQPSLGDAIKARFCKKKPPASDPHRVYAAPDDANCNGGDTGDASPSRHAANGHPANKRVFGPASASSSWTWGGG